MSVFQLSDYERDPAKYLQRLLAEANRRTAAQAEQSSRAAEEARYREAYNARHSAEGPKRA